MFMNMKTNAPKNETCVLRFVFLLSFVYGNSAKLSLAFFLILKKKIPLFWSLMKDV